MVNEITAHQTLTGDISLEGGRRVNMKLNTAPRIVAIMPIGAKEITRRFRTPDDQMWLAPSVTEQATVPAPWVTAQMSMVPPTSTGIHYLFRWGLLSGEARQIMTMAALDRVQDNGYLWYLDDDVIMPPYGLFTLYNFMEQHPEAGLVTGVYSSRTNPTEPFIYKEHLSGSYWGLTVGPAAVPEEIFGCGAGFMLARVKAVKDIIAANPGKPIWADSQAQKERPDGSMGGESWGHDIRFCRLLQESGWKVYVDGRVECGHFDVATGVTHYLPEDSPPKVRGRGQPVNDVARMALILPTYGHLDYAAKCAASFRKHTQYGPAIIAVDDGTPGLTNEQFAAWAEEQGIEHAYRFEENGGLTRSWNYGLALARAQGYHYTVCGNSDTIFSPGWDVAVRAALDKVDLASPITNASGFGTPLQNVGHYVENYKLSDAEEDIAAVADMVKALEPSVFDQHLIGMDAEKHSVVVLPHTLNGFTLVAKTRTWWAGAYNKDNVFNPKHKLTENELELQLRWHMAGRRMAVAPGSFVFHYRAVSRGDQHMCEGAFRPCEQLSSPSEPSTCSTPDTLTSSPPAPECQTT